MCQCKARGFTACAVCLGLILAPFGGRNPPASVVSQILSVPVVATTSTVTMASVGHYVEIADTVTGALRRVPRPISEIVIQKLWPLDIEPG